MIFTEVLRGTIGLYLAHKASKVICVEEIKEAVDDAHQCRIK